MSTTAAGSVTSTVAQLHASATVVDAHNDLLMACTRHRHAEQAHYFRTAWLPQLRAGGVKVQVLPVFIDADHRPEGALRQTLQMLETGWRIAAGNADTVTVCVDGADIEQTLAEGRIALVLALEGCEAVGTDVGLFETMHRLGVRMASFTHFGRTALADGSAEDAAGSRLTSAGIEAVAACEELGIMLDVSHLGATCTDHLLELATRPLVASHSSAYALRAHHRNLTDDRIRGIAGTGGVVGVNVLATFVDENDHTVRRVGDHIDHVASLVGPGHVGLGPDFIKEVSSVLDRPGDVEWGLKSRRPYVPELEGPAGLPHVTAELSHRGWSDDDVRSALGGAFHRLFSTELGVPASARRGATEENA
ncbi:dipeptidase [Pseudonocardia sp. CA-107938]|uniref:dipeptidase n=1 Tax=Pseudonocardia sp. CA-107938 TaxID=3240021 RepID=UPI003D9118F1